ncbi:MAG TPA: tagaturonate epimerase family protein [Planctomycetota bacterium]|nr:tagaturonate epimerase family protein [Planctomycetota bacterium]
MELFQSAARPGAPAALPSKSREALARAVRTLAHWDRSYTPSALSYQGAWILAGRTGRQSSLAIGYPAGKRPRWAAGLRGFERSEGDVTILLAEGDHETLVALRQSLPFLAPRPTGSGASFGFGDRTGLATPGHLRALEGSGFFPNLAQQSIREMGRTQRTPQDVLDAAVFGALQAGHLTGFGADADHLKTLDDVDRCAEAGFVMFTLDAIEKVQDKAPRMSDAELEAEYRKVLDEVPGARSWEKKYLGRSFTFEKRLTVTFEGRAWREGVVKYGRGIPYWLEMDKRARQKTRGRDCEIEIAVDETGAVTTAAEHLFIVRELQERGMTFQGLAPRFVGEFEKGVDYKGERKVLEDSVVEHAILARAHGGYKISVHSGSDKFSVYPMIAKATAGKVHLKTAGTSWMEALRVIVRKDPGLFRDICDHVRGQFTKDRASYHISGDPEKVPPPGSLKDAELERIYVVEDDGRQIMHVTYGSAFTAKDASGRWLFRDRIFEVLTREEDLYADCLEHHLGRHVKGLKAGMTRKRRSAVGAKR